MGDVGKGGKGAVTFVLNKRPLLALSPIRLWRIFAIIRYEGEGRKIRGKERRGRGRGCCRLGTSSFQVWRGWQGFHHWYYTTRSFFWPRQGGKVDMFACRHTHTPDLDQNVISLFRQVEYFKNLRQTMTLSYILTTRYMWRCVYATFTKNTHNSIPGPIQRLMEVDIGDHPHLLLLDCYCPSTNCCSIFTDKTCWPYTATSTMPSIAKTDTTLH